MIDPPPLSTSASNRRYAIAGAAGLAVVAGVIWYFAVYDTAQNKCDRGDLGACMVVAGQQAAAQASASADAQASADAAAAQASAAAEQQQAQASASASASASAQAAADAAARAAWLARVGATCQRVGGRWDGSACRIQYRSPADGALYNYTVQFDAQGNVTPLSGQSAAECPTSYGAAIKGYWHPDTDVCSV
jgi:hypothetical protein